MWIVGFLLVLGPLVTLHELGHYLVGRLFGVKADAFSIGFGKELAGWTDKRGTRWKLSALPLGGYVQFAGDMSASSQPSQEWLSLPASERNQTFQAKPLWQRALIVAAGPATNLLVAVGIIAAFLMVYGKPVPADPAEENYVASFTEKSAAQAAGVHIGDRIIAIDGKAMTRWEEVKEQIALRPGTRMTFTLERGGERLTIPITTASSIARDEFGNESRIGLIGVMPRDVERKFEAVGPVEAVGMGFVECWQITRFMVTGIKQILVGDRSVKELGGPIKIAKFSGERLSLGWEQFVSFAALISLNLAFINLLPIPTLDGGHLAFYAAEAIRRKPASQRSQEWAYRTGIAFVLALMLFVTINDIASLPIFGG
ncbi:RIP metalloprotease RseP [Altererythrobacter salegens]|uniref:Zinc metalloprotease n=2 Tax=Croceibacterium salegens TaxID=1737568 RepID=A0A6I4STJ9_9SPHN|nr:RIP metalloprotease RseP [Croceibacterium salegens]